MNVTFRLFNFDALCWQIPYMGPFLRAPFVPYLFEGSRRIILVNVNTCFDIKLELS